MSSVTEKSSPFENFELFVDFDEPKEQLDEIEFFSKNENKNSVEGDTIKVFLISISNQKLGKIKHCWKWSSISVYWLTPFVRVSSTELGINPLFVFQHLLFLGKVGWKPNVS